MSNGLTENDLEQEWQTLLPRNWYSIYQWKRITRVRYLEWIADRIASCSEIQLNEESLRARSFKINSHRGQIKLNTSIKQLTEKRFVRAMYNWEQISALGKVLDYEVPLKNTDKAKHGDIDLLCVLKDEVLCIEAKKPKSNESILKAILQAYVYTSLVSTKKDLFLTSWKLDQKLKLTPAILTFEDAQSGQQLKNINRYPKLLNLIRKLNLQLASNGIEPLRFFLVVNPCHELANCLTTITTSGDVKVVFHDDFNLAIIEHRLAIAEV